MFLQEDKYENCLTIKSSSKFLDGRLDETTTYYAPSIGIVKEESELTLPQRKMIASMVLVKIHKVGGMRGNRPY